MEKSLLTRIEEAEDRWNKAYRDLIKACEEAVKELKKPWGKEKKDEQLR